MNDPTECAMCGGVIGVKTIDIDGTGKWYAVCASCRERAEDNQ